MEQTRSYTPVLVILGVLAAGGTGLWYYNKTKGLTENFVPSDVSRSKTATDQGIKEQFKVPGNIMKNARLFARKVLQPVRDELGAPIFVNSWWRHPKTNAAVGGASDSAHLKAQAADLRTVINQEFRNDILARAVLTSEVPFTKMILEYGTLDRPLLVHLRYTPGDDSRIFLYKDNSGSYSPINRKDYLSAA